MAGVKKSGVKSGVTKSGVKNSSSYSWLLRGSFSPGRVRATWTTSTRRIDPDIEHAIDVAWTTTLQRPGVTLFDGPVVRCESFEVTADETLELSISRTSYKICVGTHFINPHFPPEVRANLIGASTGVISSDGHLLMGVRNHRVAYYPGRVHPFAGSLEVRDVVDVFEDARREIFEEIGVQSSEITSIRCMGIARDEVLFHPELIFIARTSLLASEIESRLDKDEHESVVRVVDIEDERLTPIARAIANLKSQI